MMPTRVPLMIEYGQTADHVFEHQLGGCADGVIRVK